MTPDPPISLAFSREREPEGARRDRLDYIRGTDAFLATRYPEEFAKLILDERTHYVGANAIVGGWRAVAEVLGLEGKPATVKRCVYRLISDWRASGLVGFSQGASYIVNDDRKSVFAVGMWPIMPSGEPTPSARARHADRATAVKRLRALEAEFGLSVDGPNLERILAATTEDYDTVKAATSRCSESWVIAPTSVFVAGVRAAFPHLWDESDISVRTNVHLEVHLPRATPGSAPGVAPTDARVHSFDDIDGRDIVPRGNIVPTHSSLEPDYQSPPPAKGEGEFVYAGVMAEEEFIARFGDESNPPAKCAHGGADSFIARIQRGVDWPLSEAILDLG